MHRPAISLHVASYPAGPGYEATLHGTLCMCTYALCTGRLLAVMSLPRCVNSQVVTLFLVQGVREGEGGGNSGTQADRKSVLWRRL